jgi:NAD-dependent SIR2 family protein deacetylase
VSYEALERFVRDHERLFVITGAGVSAPSGIGTYRDHDGRWQRSAPVQHQDFVSRASARRRYWARSLRGWPSFERAEPNPAHRALAELERRGCIDMLVTQNVDGLHQRAGHERLLELHGSLARVVCLDCGACSPRRDVQAWLEARNSFLLDVRATPAPDGDADLAGQEDDARVQVPDCSLCGGLLKPDVVFYGDSVPKPRVEQAFRALNDADAVLVVGSSLMVYSSFRFCRRAAEREMPMAAVNLGRTRADQWFVCKLEADCATVLPRLADSMA